MTSVRTLGHVKSAVRRMPERGACQPAGARQGEKNLGKLFIVVGKTWNDYMCAP